MAKAVRKEIASRTTSRQVCNRATIGISEKYGGRK